MANRRRTAPGNASGPHSALNLRLALAIFGVASMVILTALFVWLRYPGLAVLTAVGAMVAVVNAIVVQRRRAARSRREPGEKHSLFE